MTDLLKQLGDDWHNPAPYRTLVDSVLPSSSHAKDVERCLVEFYVDELNNFKLMKSKNSTTVYDMEIDLCSSRLKILEQDLKKEEERFEKFLEKFKEQEQEQEQQQQGVEEEEDDEEEDTHTTTNTHTNELIKSKGKGSKPCKRTLKAEDQRKRALGKGAKSSMASSQVTLMEIRQEIDHLELKKTYYAHYQRGSWYYMKAMREVALRYSETKDLRVLIKDLEETLKYYHMLMRRYVPHGACSGKEKGLCETHLLPLQVTIYPNDAFKHVLKCHVSP